VIEFCDEGVFQPIHEHLGYQHSQNRLARNVKSDRYNVRGFETTNICDDPKHIASTKPAKTLWEEKATREIKFRPTKFN
jgi:hypothetical protein